MIKNSSSTLKYLWKYFRQYKNLLFAVALFLILSRAASTAEPVFLRNIINAITAKSPYSVLLVLLIYYFAVRIGSVVFEYLRDYISAPVIMGVTKDLEKDVFRHLLRLHVGYHADAKTGAAARAITRGTQAISFMLDFAISSLIPPILELIFVAVILLKLYSWQYGTITVLTILFYTWFTIWSTEKRTIYREKGNAKDDEAGGLLVDSVSNIETVKYFGNEKPIFKKYSAIKDAWFDLMVRNNRLFSLIYAAQGLILLTGLGMIFYLAIKQAFLGLITVGDLVLLSTYIVRLSIPISTLGFVYARFKNSVTDLASMEKILEEPVELNEPLNPVKIVNPKGEVSFGNVCFGYLKNQAVVHNLSFDIKPGIRAAFVGPSGAGKSTIAKLIFRLYDVDEGEIKIDNIDLKQISSDDRERLMAIVPQDSALFNDTVAANIRFGKLDAADEEVINAAKAAHIHEFIVTLPEKYETMVGERGIKMSGGQRQRIAIARAIIKNPKILVFDEATSSLDSASEQAVLKTINEVATGRTSISIAHRLSTIVNSDIIFVLKNGLIVEKGTHQELLNQKGVYAELWQIQTHSRSTAI